MKYSIIIPVLGNIEWLDSLLGSIERNCRRRHSEVIVVNDATDRVDSELMEFLKKQRRIDVLVEHGSPRGFAAAINSGVRNSCAGLLAVFHTDVVVGPNTLGRLASRILPAGPASVVSATCCYAPYAPYVLSKEVYYRFVENFKPENKPACTADDIRHSLTGLYGDFDAFCRAVRITCPDLVYTEEGYLFAAMMSRSTWDMVGEMDESFAGRGMADRLWVDRLCATGGQMYVDRSTYCHHHGNATSDGPGFEHGRLLRETTRQYEVAQREILRETGRLP